MSDELRGLTCKHCNKYLAMTSKDDIVAFCDDTCLNSYTIDETTESKDEMLQALSYAQNREDLD